MAEWKIERRYKTRSVAGTLTIAERVAETLMPVALSSGSRLIVLRGQLGAGKTTLVKGIAAALGAADADEVTSPTFTLVHEYSGANIRLYHLDLYRLETERELLTLGLDEMLDEPGALILVEWGEKFASVTGMATGEVVIEHLGEDERQLTVRVR